MWQIAMVTSCSGMSYNQMDREEGNVTQWEGGAAMTKIVNSSLASLPPPWQIGWRMFQFNLLLSGKVEDNLLWDLSFQAWTASWATLLMPLPSPGMSSCQMVRTHRLRTFNILPSSQDRGPTQTRACLDASPFLATETCLMAHLGWPLPGQHTCQMALPRRRIELFYTELLHMHFKKSDVFSFG